MALNKERIQKLASLIEQRGLDAYLIAPSPDMIYFMDHMPLFCYRFQGLFVKKDGNCFYVCNLLTEEEIRAVLPDCPIYAWFDGEGFVETVRRALAENGLIGKKIGVNNCVRAFNILEIASAMDVEFVNASDLGPETRIIKTEHQIDLMREAGRIGQEALEKTLRQIKPGMTEKQVRDILRGHMAELGGERVGGGCASGPNSGYPHYDRDDRVLEKGDTLLIDFGCQYHELGTDITRTVFLGKPSDRQIEIHGIVKKAILAAEQAVLDGERWIPNIDLAARKVIEEAGYGSKFTTRLGHGMGYMFHEAPDIKQNNKRYLEPGMAFTIEPGIYLGGDIGVRIEDCIAIHLDNTAEVLTDDFTKDYIVLDC